MSTDQPPNGWSRPPRKLPIASVLRLDVRVPHLIVDHPTQGPLYCAFDARARLTVGRAPWCEIVIDWDRAVSRAHAVVEAFGPLLTVEPAGATTNAVEIDRVATHTRAPLQDGQRITLGATELHVRLPPDGALLDTIRVEGGGEAPPVSLTRAERRVATELANDPEATNRQIAETLGLAHETVRSHIQGLLRKGRAVELGGDPVDRTTVVDRLRAAGLLDLGSTDDPPSD